MNRSPPKTTNLAPLSSLFASQHCPHDSVGASDNIARNTLSKDTQFRQLTNQIYPPPGYMYSPSQPPFPGAPLLNQHVPFYITPSSQRSTVAIERISQLWAILATIWFRPRRLWWTSIVPPSAIHKTWAVISRRSSSAFSTTSKQCSHSADISLLFCTRTTSRYTRGTPHSPHDEPVSASCGTGKAGCCRNSWFALITSDFRWPMQCRFREWWFTGLGQGRRRKPQSACSKQNSP
jgi:hypothetical protein